jgi:hypothetical protein
VHLLRAIRIVAYVVGINNLIHYVQIALTEELFKQSAGKDLILLRHRVNPPFLRFPWRISC